MFPTKIAREEVQMRVLEMNLYLSYYNPYLCVTLTDHSLFHVSPVFYDFCLKKNNNAGLKEFLVEFPTMLNRYSLRVEVIVEKKIPTE